MNESLRASYRFCGSLSRREARNFYASFLLLPADRRRSMCALYAFMRQTDDIADAPDPTGDRHAALADWRAAVHSALDGGPADRWPGLPALADTVARHAIPRAYLDDVLDGVAMDLEPRTFATFEDLYAYCYRVASAVGLCCLHIWGFDDNGGRARALAESCGLALQLTNIIRDVAEDKRNGRIYLPTDDMDRFGVRPEELAEPRASEPLRALLAFEAQRAYAYYEAARPLAALVAPVGRPGLRMIVGIYRALLDEIAARGYEVLSGRVSVPAWRKLAIMFRSLVGASPKLEEAEASRC